MILVILAVVLTIGFIAILARDQTYTLEDHQDDIDRAEKQRFNELMDTFR